LYLLVRLASGSDGPPNVFHLEFSDQARARKALSQLENADPEQYSVSVENEVGHVICIRRSSLHSAWIADELPPEPVPTAGINKAALLKRLGRPTFEGPSGFGWIQVGDAPVHAGPSRENLLMWQCSDDIENPAFCTAINDGTSNRWRYRPCPLHRG
jgi:hypothetical protein